MTTGRECLGGDVAEQRVRVRVGVAAVGALALLIGLLVGLGAGQASAATVTGRFANLGGGCMENSNNSTAANNPQWLNVCGTNVGQQYSRWSDGTIRVQGRCVDTLAGATANNTRVVLVVCSATSTSQKWTFYATGFIQNQKSRTCLAPQNNRIAAKVAMTIAACVDVNAQKWTVPAVSTPDTTTPPPTTTTTVPPATTTTAPPVTTTTTVPPVTTTTTVPPVTTTVPPVTTTTTAPPTTTTTTSLPPQTTQTWDSSFTSSGFAKFDDTPWNNVGASAPVIVDSPVTSGAKAAQFTMPGGGTRSEIVPTTASFTEGQDRWFRFSFHLPADFPTQVTTWQLLTQWKNDGTGSPPLELTVRDGNLNLSGGYGHPAGPQLFNQVLSPATTGRRIDLVVHVFFSRDPARGTVDVWRDGTQVLAGYRPPGGTLYPTDKKATASMGSYWKMGIYRDSAITLPARYTIESAKVGNTRAQVG